MTEIQVADLLVHIGTTHWATPWHYIREAGYFDYAEVENGQIVGSHPGGQGRGVNLRIPTVPALPEGYEFVPGESRIGIIHDKARVGGAGPLPVVMERVASIVWDGRADAELSADLTYEDAAELLQVIDPAQFPFLAYRIQDLLVKAMDAGVVKTGAKPGVIGYAVMAERPFVQYTREDDTPEPDDPRITLVKITDDASKWDDPTGRTRYV